MMVNASHTGIGCFRAYNFGFNGQEKDDEIKTNGNSLDFGARGYDPRLGKWWSLDPLEVFYPGASGYSYGLDNPIWNIDSEGNFVIRGTKDEKDRLQAFVNAAWNELAANPNLLKVLMDHTGFSKKDLETIFTDGKGPALQISSTLPGETLGKTKHFPGADANFMLQGRGSAFTINLNSLFLVLTLTEQAIQNLCSLR